MNDKILLELTQEEARKVRKLLWVYCYPTVMDESYMRIVNEIDRLLRNEKD